MDDIIWAVLLLTLPVLLCCDSAWPDSHKWGAPAVLSAVEEQDWTRGDSATVYRADVIRMLRTGKVTSVHAGYDDMALSVVPFPS